MNSLIINNNLTKREYLGLMSRIGFSLLLFILLSYILPSVAIIFEMIGQFIFSEQPLPMFVISSAFYFFAYIGMFIIPAVLFFLISRNKAHEGFSFSIRLPENSFFYVSAALAVTTVAAFINSQFVGAIRAPVEAEPISTVHELIFNIFLIAIAPAIAEEILFRGVILKNMLPYGKGLAVIGSALLFGLMHQNGAQLFYTTIAGIMFALVYVKTGSLFLGMIFHFVNNLLSVIEEYIFGAFGSAVSSLFNATELTLILVIGIISAVKLLSDHRKDKKDLEAGVFERELDEDMDYSARKITQKTAVLGFLTPPMLVFVAESFVMSILTLFISVI